MDLGTGKDLHEYGPVPHHLIDVLEPGEEFSLFSFVRGFTAAHEGIIARGRLPILVGGTGLYLDAVLRGYELAEVPKDPELRSTLATLDISGLQARLLASSPRVHNTTDLLDRERLVRAIEIAEALPRPPIPLPELHPWIIGLRWERPMLRQRILTRLKERVAAGMIAEVEGLRNEGVADSVLESYGLEYRYVTRHLQGELSRNDLIQQLASAICDFAKRQESWFRRMERHGVQISWVDGAGDPLVEALSLVAM